MATDPHIGTSIKRARERKRWTQRQLADALGVDRKTVDNWENSRTSPRSSIGALEEVLGISLGDTDEDAADRLEAEASALLQQARALRARRQKKQDEPEGTATYRDARHAI